MGKGKKMSFFDFKYANYNFNIVWVGNIWSPPLNLNYKKYEEFLS